MDILLLFLVILCTLYNITNVQSAEPCNDLQSCCRANGLSQDSSLCYSTKYDCYCDSGCVVTGDCCSDYYTFCKNGEGVDCKYKEWTPWGDCIFFTRSLKASDTCRVGLRTRTRQIDKLGNFNGLPCQEDETEQKEICNMDSCTHIDIDYMKDIGNYMRENSNFSRAIYKVIATDCGEFKEGFLFCIYCPDSNAGCQNLPLNQSLQFRTPGGCKNTWEKITLSVNRQQCRSNLPYKQLTFV